MADALVKHAFVSAIPQGTDPTKIRTDDWNAFELFSGGSVGEFLIRDPVSATGASWGPSPVGANVRLYGATGDGTTDDTTAIQAAITAVGLIGGIVWFPVGTYRCNGQLILPNDGAAPPTQKPQRWIGTGAHFSGQTMAPAGGSVLDLRYAGADAKIKTHGLGSLEITGLTLKDDGTSTNPFFLTTLTTVYLHDVAFIGNPSKANATCDQDAVVLGGTSILFDGTDDAAFQGYGTVIERCYFARIRRGVYLRTYANGIVVRDNTWWNTCGATSGAAAIELLGLVASPCTGNHILGNLIEMVGYVYGIRTKHAVNNYFANSLFDPGGGTVSHYLFEDNSLYSFVLDVYRNDSKPLVTESGSAVGTNSWLTPHQSQTSFMAQPWTFKNTATFQGIAAFACNPFSAVTIKPGVALANDAVAPFVVSRSAAESSNPSAEVFSLQQSGKLVLSGSGSGNLDFNSAAGALVAQFAANGKNWILAGAGGNMEINSGTGGSYIRFTAFGLKLRDQANANEVFIKSGTGAPALAAPVGSIWLRTDGSTGTTLYVKETGAATSSGWVAK